MGILFSDWKLWPFNPCCKSGCCAYRVPHTVHPRGEPRSLRTPERCSQRDRQPVADGHMICKYRDVSEVVVMAVLGEEKEKEREREREREIRLMVVTR